MGLYVPGNGIRNILPNGREYMDCDAGASPQEILISSFQDCSSTTPIFFILSPGADPVKEVEAMGERAGKWGEEAASEVS